MYKESEDARRSIDGTLNRMHLAKDEPELAYYYEWSKKHLDWLYKSLGKEKFNTEE